MNASVPLQADREQIGRFVSALFRYADEGTYVSLRSFPENQGPPFAIEAHRLTGDLDRLVDLAEGHANRAARTGSAVVFAPPIATFADERSASEDALRNGLALSVECDQSPDAAREKLEAILGPATVVVASGGEWADPVTGEVQAKLHLHWRLTEPTRDPAGHADLKAARGLAMDLAGGDPTSKPAVHPMRWPGSWHRKGAPRLVRIVSLTDTEIDLQEALDRLRDARAATRPSGDGKPSKAGEETRGESRETAALVAAVLSGADFHAPITALAMRYLKGGMTDAQVVLTLRGIMEAVPEPRRDLKGSVRLPGRWQSRFDDIPRAVSTARAKIGEERDGWPDPIDFLGDAEMTGAPELRPGHLPDALAGFVFDTAERMGVDPAAVALCATVACAAVVSDGWQAQPKVHDHTWTESARLWGAIVGGPSILKTPVLKACTAPVDKLDAEARQRHAEAMRHYKAEVARAKAAKDPAADALPQPRLERHLVEGTTMDALTEVLRDDDAGRQRAPAGKVLVRQDELSEWLASFDAYKGGSGRGSADRGAYLRLFNGGRYVLDRVGRGNFAIPNWSACILGGIQPEPIQRIAREGADDGLLQRFLYCVPVGQTAGEDRAPDVAALRRYADLFPALARLHGAAPGAEPQRVRFAPEAQLHREAINALAAAVAAQPTSSTRLQSALGKWTGVFTRLALTFHLIGLADAQVQGRPVPDPLVLTADTARRAAAYMRDVLLPHLLRADELLFLTRQTGHARWIAGFLLSSAAARDMGRVALRDLQRAYAPLRAPEHRREVVEVMSALDAMGWVKAEIPDNPARGVSAWAVNPKLHAVFAERAAAERARRDRAQAEAAEAIRRARAAA